MIDHIRLFPDGLSPEDIENNDEQEKARQELVKTAKQVLLQSIDLYITDLERNNLVEKNSPITGATISFTPERLAELSMKDDDGKPILNADDVLEVLGVDEGALKTKVPIEYSSTDKEFHFFRYTTNEPVLSYIKEAKLTDPISVRDYFQLTEDELKRVSEERAAEEHARANNIPRIPSKGDREYAEMEDMVDRAHGLPGENPSSQDLRWLERQIDGENN